MKLITDIKEKLQYHINNNEVVYQFCSELMGHLKKRVYSLLQ